VAGAAAQFTLYDPSATREFGTGDLTGKGINSPYLAMTLPGRVVTTFHNGYPTVLDGVVQAADTVAAHAAEWAVSVRG
jgi:dihydroorotase